MRVSVDLGGGIDRGWLRHSRMLALAIKPLLDANVKVNRLYLATNKTPSIYQAGVRYREEDPRQGYEDFAIVPAIIARGWGDCDDLAPWRVAELQNAGEHAEIRIQWKKIPNRGKLFHIVVRRANGSIEDPSRLLGMKG